MDLVTHFSLLLGPFVALCCVACQPDLAPASRSGSGGGGGAGGGDPRLSFELEPNAEPDAVPRALRIRIHADEEVDASLVRFVEGDVGPGHLRQLRTGDPSNALEERILSASIWREDGGDIIVAPHALLKSDERYAVAIPDRGLAFELRSRHAVDDPTLPRVWPPIDVLASSPTLVFCGEEELAPIDVLGSLAPGAHAASIQRGAVASGVGRRCLRVAATESVEHGELLIAPPAFGSAGVVRGLDPSPLVMGRAEIATSLPLVCEASEVAFGPGCILLLDDRAIVRTPSSSQLWVVGGGEVDLVVATAPNEPFVVGPFAIDSEVSLDLTWFDETGREATSTFRGRTSRAVPHLVLNETLANAVGPEPASEWVEIVNDGVMDVSLGGYVLADLGGEVELPEVVLGPSEIALVVGDGWTGDGLDDVAPPPGTLIVRVPRIGRSGIANGGEPLRLRNAQGEIVSTIPPIESPDPGMSTARREPWLADAPSSFVSAIPTPGAPNGAP